MRTSVSRNFRQFIVNKYPTLAGNQPFLRFFRFLCFGDFFDQQTKQLVIPTRKMAEDFYLVKYSTYFRGLDVLEQFRAKVLPDLAWSGHERLAANSWNGKARQITCTGFDTEMQAALKEECLNPSEDQVDFVKGDTFRREDLYRARAAETAAYEKELSAFTLNATQTKILGYLRRINAGHLFLPKITENHQAIEEAIASLPPNVQDIQYRALANIRQNPNPYYFPSTRERTCRLSPRGVTIAGLSKGVRKAATKGWWECDLRSSQFAILAAKLNAPISQAFIASGESLWRELNRWLTGQEAEPPGEVKAILKETIYALCFGKSRANLKEFLAPYGMTGILKHPILKELLDLRNGWFKQIEKDGGAHDVWGVWHAVDEANHRWAGSIGATVFSPSRWR